MKTVLSIGTHPDDIEIGCGGTEALLKERGYRLFHVVVTDGKEGGMGNQALLSERRRKEALESGRVLGVEEVVFLGMEDGLTSFDKKSKERLIGLVREIRPQILFTHAKDDLFPDHRIVRQLTEAAVQGASGPWYPGAGGAPYSVPDVFGYEVWNPIRSPQLLVDISSTLEKKLSALRCHQTQVESVDYASAVVGLSAYRGVASMKGRCAEAFEVLKMELSV